MKTLFDLITYDEQKYDLLTTEIAKQAVSKLVAKL
jgi:hypothetical protein